MQHIGGAITQDTRRKSVLPASDKHTKELYEEPYEKYYDEPYSLENPYSDVSLTQRLIMPNLPHGIPDQTLDSHTQDIAFYQYITKHYAEEDMLADLLYVVGDAKHRKDHHPIVKGVLSESLRHLPKLHDDYFRTNMDAYDRLLGSEAADREHVGVYRDI